MKSKIDKIIKNFWVQLFFILSSIFGLYKTYSDAITSYLSSNISWLLAATITSLVCGSFLACIHAFLSSKRNRKDLLVFNARIDGQFKKIDSQFESVAESFKGLEKGISDTVDYAASIQKDLDERFKWLYEQIHKDKKDSP